MLSRRPGPAGKQPRRTTPPRWSRVPPRSAFRGTPARPPPRRRGRQLTSNPADHRRGRRRRSQQRVCDERSAAQRAGRDRHASGCRRPSGQARPVTTTARLIASSAGGDATAGRTRLNHSRSPSLTALSRRRLAWRQRSSVDARQLPVRRELLPSARDAAAATWSTIDGITAATLRAGRQDEIDSAAVELHPDTAYVVGCPRHSIPPHRPAPGSARTGTLTERRGAARDALWTTCACLWIAGCDSARGHDTVGACRTGSRGHAWPHRPYPTVEVVLEPPNDLPQTLPGSPGGAHVACRHARCDGGHAGVVRQVGRRSAQSGLAAVSRDDGRVVAGDDGARPRSGRGARPRWTRAARTTCGISTGYAEKSPKPRSANG